MPYFCFSLTETQEMNLSNSRQTKSVVEMEASQIFGSADDCPLSSVLLNEAPRPWRTQRSPRSILTKLIPPPAQFRHSADEISSSEPGTESPHESGRLNPISLTHHSYISPDTIFSFHTHILIILLIRIYFGDSYFSSLFSSFFSTSRAESGRKHTRRPELYYALAVSSAVP